ncbi:MAG: SpoIID/LytB domain-containing protein [Candidatus Goldbacteria bacterium]|nr:SpoIID/LytB domain-containing protein [Candidatus Goldiibacteriota bacterium]
MRVLSAAAVLLIFSFPLYAQTLKVRILNIYHPKTLEAVQLNGGEKVKVRYVKGNNIEVINNKGRQLTAEYRLNGGKYGEYEIRVNGRRFIYKGSVFFFLPPDEKEAGIIVEMGLEDYVAASLDGELEGAYSHPESDKALAVAIRTYAERNRKRHGYYDLCDLTHCQRLNGRPELNRGSSIKAANGTRGLILAGKDNKPADIYFSGCCGGESESAGNVWRGENNVKSVVRCGAASGNFCEKHIFHRWEKKIKASEIRSVIRESLGERISGSIDFITGDVSPGGNVRLIKVKHTKGVTEMPADKFISAYGKKYGWANIPSRKFAVEKRGSDFILSGRGAGHGCGLCLAGAHALAVKGWTCEGILSFYYPDTKMIKTPE